MTRSATFSGRPPDARSTCLRPVDGRSMSRGSQPSAICSPSPDQGVLARADLCLRSGSGARPDGTRTRVKQAVQFPRTSSVSVCEQNRHAHVLEHVAGDAAQHHLTQARMPVAAHDEKIGFLLVGLGQNQLPYRRPAALYRFDTRADLMTRQMGEDARAGPLAKADAELAG